jgi:leader peptidase (prepilin peptidase)/N-methyltransferase
MAIANFFIHLIIFSLGACIGSFLNVVVYRLPAGLSLISPPSRCPSCLHPLGKTENVPVLGWLWLRGKCRWCGVPISPRYPFVEAMTGGLFVLVFEQYGLTWLSLGYVILISWLIALALIDFDTMILPNSLTQTGLAIGLIWQIGLGFSDGGLKNAIDYLFWAILSGVIAIWLFDAILIIGTLIVGKPAMGGGDPKLAAMIGVWLGWQEVLITGFLACAIGTIIGISAIACGWLKKGQPFPFGPFLAIGALLTLFWGDSLLTTYLRWTGLG